METRVSLRYFVTYCGLFNNPFTSCFLINFYFLSPHTVHFDNIIIPLFVAFETCKKCFLRFLHTLDNKMTLFLYTILAFHCIQRSCAQWNCIQEKISPNTGILLRGVFIPTLLNIPLASCFLINFDLLLSHIAHFDNIIVLPLLVFETLGVMLSVFFLHFKQ